MVNTVPPLRALITGGSGFIGSHLRDRLRNAGVGCTILDLVEPSALSSNEQFVFGDVRDAQAVRKSLEGVSVIYHLAAAHHDFGIDEHTFESVNVEGMRLVCEGAHQAGVQRILFTSSVAVYGTGTPGADEHAAPQPESPYGRTKLAAEQVLREWHVADAQRTAIVIRPAVVYGPRSFANMFSLARQIHRGRFAMVGDGANVKSIVYVENLIELMAFLLESAPSGQWSLLNAVDAPDLSSREIAITLARAFGRSGIPSLPFGVARFAAIPFDVLTKLTGRDLGFSSARLHKFAFQETRFSGAAARTAGYQQCVPSEEGLRRMAEWYAREGVHVGTPPRHLPPAEVQRR